MHQQLMSGLACSSANGFLLLYFKLLRGVNRRTFLVYWPSVNYSNCRKIVDLQCTQCKFSTSRDDKLTNHVKRVHDKIKAGLLISCQMNKLPLTLKFNSSNRPNILDT